MKNINVLENNGSFLFIVFIISKLPYDDFMVIGCYHYCIVFFLAKNILFIPPLWYIIKNINVLENNGSFLFIVFIISKLPYDDFMVIGCYHYCIVLAKNILFIPPLWYIIKNINVLENNGSFLFIVFIISKLPYDDFMVIGCYHYCIV